MRIFKLLIVDENAASAIEYAVVASLIAVAALAGYQNLGNGVTNQYNGIETEMD
ncbi:Flp family type IVb pilin [Sphingomicrobium clamense]|uniref:Flp family type IVb pilin n=1 Tax=Sphingomicrobium clamense TaxID=2851013 RepID=A0ABS6V2P0_9SPHN|nr:Flp family type IVb pilin [Sphingomicrobium sp. B8]MBW0143809.1 Flp family type IVb pilin [Sphingomicrobium sp. B8]